MVGLWQLIKGGQNVAVILSLNSYARSPTVRSPSETPSSQINVTSTLPLPQCMLYLRMCMCVSAGQIFACANILTVFDICMFSCEHSHRIRVYWHIFRYSHSRMLKKHIYGRTSVYVECMWASVGDYCISCVCVQKSSCTCGCLCTLYDAYG